MMTIIGSIVNINVKGGGGRGTIQSFNGNENLHFDNEYDNHTSSETYEESGYALNLELLTISYQSSVPYPRRSGPIGKVTK